MQHSSIHVFKIVQHLFISRKEVKWRLKRSLTEFSICFLHGPQVMPRLTLEAIQSEECSLNMQTLNMQLFHADFPVRLGTILSHGSESYQSFSIAIPDKSFTTMFCRPSQNISFWVISNYIPDKNAACCFDSRRNRPIDQSSLYNQYLLGHGEEESIGYKTGWENINHTLP